MKKTDMPEELCVNGKVFRVIRILGKGKGGYSFLVCDGTGEYVLKQIHHEPCAYYQFGDKMQSEINDYHRLKQVGIRLPEMLDVDLQNERILKEYIPGDTVYDIVASGGDAGIYIGQIMYMCSLLYPAGLNIDYFPTNFIARHGELYYIDYECNAYMDEWNFENWGIHYWSRTTEFLEYQKGRKE